MMPGCDGGWHECWKCSGSRRINDPESWDKGRMAYRRRMPCPACRPHEAIAQRGVALTPSTLGGWVTVEVA